MNKKAWLAIPIAVIPYLALFALATVFFATENAFFEYIMESVFGGNALILIGALLACCVLATASAIVWLAVSVHRGWNPLLLAKTAMIVKLIQVPAYVVIFVLGVLFAVSIFTIPFSVGLFLLDCWMLLLSGLLTVAAAINAVRQGVFKSKEVIWILVLQLVFCADVVTSIVFYLRLREKLKHCEHCVLR